jgi:hypothetical protein
VTDYVLKISSYGGLVAGARHYRGRVEGPHPKSCHGAMSYNAPESRGKWTCSEGHEIPGQREWDVEAGWTEERYSRWANKSFEGDGPQQFLDQAKLIEAAAKRFSGELPRNWWEEEPEAGKPGDRLFLDFVPRDPAEIDEEWGRIMGTPPYGSLLAEIPAEDGASS